MLRGQGVASNYEQKCRRKTDEQTAAKKFTNELFLKKNSEKMNETQIKFFANLLSNKEANFIYLNGKLAQEEIDDSDSAEIRAQKAVARNKW